MFKKGSTMSNCQINTAFAFTVTAAEANLINEAIRANDYINDETTSVENIEARIDAWEKLSTEFRTIFQSSDPDDPFAEFIKIYDDPQWPEFDTDITIAKDANGQLVLTGQSDQFPADTIANLFERTLSTSLPITIKYCYDLDKFRPGNFGGGGFTITANGTKWVDTSDLDTPEEHRANLVLQTSCSDNGPLYWNQNGEFGPLENATVFTEAQASNLSPVIAYDEPEWVKLPDQLAT